ncbi:glycoside hydrolase [Thermoanaerobacterium sp. PSU-2]|uniref:glycoside hydrolase family 5 protein n=1 Tax=Thermoanaerobacterium sp. PSU-2 TaxID=1930849 RepID=UPI000A1575B3|nr:cellulase family glycosylhydrolase [Thermoanaerobacterium sp. PSU-2]ORX22725.1 glycoside hydrolase [Thermoanaerobacterium sp. PSU-2]
MKKYGFNFQWIYVWDEGKSPLKPDLKALDFLVETGFNFVRIPTDYRFWIKNFDYFNPDESVFEYIDLYLEECKKRNIHMCLNIHRGPGYCINRNDLERDNLWLDKVAQDGFVYQWQVFAKRYKGVSNKYLSFDLLNEPPDIGQYGMTREIHASLIKRTVEAIRQIDPEREIVIDGLGGGNIAMPELADIGVIHSGRGYQPMALTHYEATWWNGYKGLPMPTYPDLVWDGKMWNKDTIREYYRPWRDVEEKGVEVHIGEFGCFNKTPNEVALRWFKDLLSLYKEFEWGYSLWNFKGPFGIIEHGRDGAKYEDFYGYKVDRELLDLLIENRV